MEPVSVAEKIMLCLAGLKALRRLVYTGEMYKLLPPVQLNYVSAGERSRVDKAMTVRFVFTTISHRLRPTEVKLMVKFNPDAGAWSIRWLPLVLISIQLNSVGEGGMRYVCEQFNSLPCPTTHRNRI